MKKLSALLAAILLISMVSIPAYATDENCQAENIQIETTLTVYDISAFSSSHERYAEKKQVFRVSGKVIAEVTLSATFGYDGEEAWVVSADGSHVTYNGWSYGSERITESGNRAKLTAKLSHSGESSASVNISLTCTPSGQIS